MQNTKKEIRQKVLEERKILVESSLWTKINTMLCSNVEKWLTARSFQKIGLFFPIKGEPDIRKPLENYRQSNRSIELFLPVTKGKHMQFSYWDPSEKLTVGPYGIPIPSGQTSQTPDLLFIPCLGVNSKGFRLGYGGGYYDRYLANQLIKPTCVCICFSAFTQLQFNTERFDIKADLLITECGVVPL